jgi:GT2 family glycosyltransferase
MLHHAKELLMSVVIINFQTPKFITDCLSTLLPELKGIDARVVVVDNHSGDSSPTLIKEWLAEHDKDSKVLFLQSDKNSGFSAGNNLGIKVLDAKYYLLLNSDTLVRPGAIQIILDTISLYPKAGIVGPRLEWPDGTGQESCFRYPNPFSEFMAAAKTGFINRLLHRFIVPMPVQTRIATPEWTSFACVLIRHEVFQQIGLLDEGYFMYFEDTEFCHRACKAGWEIIHNPEASIIHLHGGSSSLEQNKSLKKSLPRYYYESRTRLFFQTIGRQGLLAANLMWWLGRMVSMPRQLLGRSDKSATEGQWIDIWTNCLNPLRKYTHPDA